jgi:hypothetical protein
MPAAIMPASNVSPVPVGWNAVVTSIGCIVSAAGVHEKRPGIFFMWNT